MTDPIRTSAEAMEDAALPRAHAVHTDPHASCAETEPMPAAMTGKPQKAKSPAEWAYQRMILYIRNFEKGLDNDHEVAMALAGDATGVMRIEGMGYFDPDIVTFYGRDPTGARTQLIQHVSRLSVLLRAMPKARQEAEPERIGFRLAADLEEGTTAGEGPPIPGA
ncbi:hypothetical protein LX81_00025 [Palleronia aestuarii]|uniref:Uncharacterized protein n=1 Tax=Palleronia aestuarii TaxID=568105 RepID=A0A2W7QCM1_9RHOB|nr:DUF6173 family protein [Palleronia aestuarii]PZX19569.1 hypothetical protein LX81_00025 [Palleronia aestuarii]